MLCTADYAIIAIVNLPVLFGQSLPCFEVFFYNNVIKKSGALLATEDWMLKFCMKNFTH